MLDSQEVLTPCAFAFLHREDYLHDCTYIWTMTASFDGKRIGVWTVIYLDSAPRPYSLNVPPSKLPSYRDQT